MTHTKTPGTENKIKFVLLWIVSYIDVNMCSLMPSAATSLVVSVNFPLIAVTECRSHAVRRVDLVILYVSDTQ